jgi:predicted enzyme related to lactoylglutathione lyase
MTDAGAFHWNELQTRDIKKAKDFYKKTLGWSYDDMPMSAQTDPGEMYGAYAIIKSGDKMIGGMFEMKGPMFDGVPENWFSYVAVADVDKLMKKVKDAGGKVIREPWDVPNVGRIAIVADSNGAVQGWMVPAPGSM